MSVRCPLSFAADPGPAGSRLDDVPLKLSAGLKGNRVPCSAGCLLGDRGDVGKWVIAKHGARRSAVSMVMPEQHLYRSRCFQVQERAEKVCSEPEGRSPLHDLLTSFCRGLGPM